MEEAKKTVNWRISCTRISFAVISKNKKFASVEAPRSFLIVDIPSSLFSVEEWKEFIWCLWITKLMGVVQDSFFIHLFDKFRSWISWSPEFVMDENKICSDCKLQFTEFCSKFRCNCCGRWLCGSCVRRSGSIVVLSTTDRIGNDCQLENFIKSCKFCPKASKKCAEKIYPCESPKERTAESLSPCKVEDGECNFFTKTLSKSKSFASSNSIQSSPTRSDEETDDCVKRIFSPTSNEYYYSSDIETSSISFRHENCDYRSVDSSPSNSPSRINANLTRVSHPVHHNVVRNEKFKKQLNFENNDDIWFPPPAEGEDYVSESNYFDYDDEDDEVGDSGGMFSSTSSVNSLFSGKEKHSQDQKEPLRSLIQCQFRALVSQLLQGEDIKFDQENESEDWLVIISNLAWQAATFVKPDTSKGGSMDPGAYVKVKCVASGTPDQSVLIKGVVCTKNIRHKRMTTKYKNPRLLLLGGSLEYQRAASDLASFNTLLEEEMNHLKIIVSRIEAHRPNVLLVEKSVSPYAQEYILTKEITLVLNVKRDLLERIAQCSGASITDANSVSLARSGNCEFFHIEKVAEELDATNKVNKRPSKTLMFFEGCPRRLGCTILLKGSCRDELKKLKRVLQYALFAAYHLSLETSFLFDEGATLPKATLQPLPLVLEDTSMDNLVTTDPDLLSMKDNELVASAKPINFPSAFIPMDEGTDDTCPDGQVSNECISPSESHQSILVSFSSHCIIKGIVCERSRLLRVKFYGSFDKPLGRYLQDDLLNPASHCRACKQSVEAHVQCYTHQQGSLTINVRRLSSHNLPGQMDGKIWMWHRCLVCSYDDEVPPATRRVVMSDAAWGLSFGKFLELSFSNHTTANRIASCGHSLQRDCLRFYGCGNMVAFFRYSEIDILSVRLPPSVLEFNGHSKQEWLRKEVDELKGKKETLYAEITDVLDFMEQKSISMHKVASNSREIVGMKDLLAKERSDYHILLQQDSGDTSSWIKKEVNILELNNLRHSLLISAYVWECRFSHLDSLLRSRWSSTSELRLDLSANTRGENVTSSLLIQSEEITLSDKLLENMLSSASNLSDKIDSAWTGTTEQHPLNSNVSTIDNMQRKRLMSPARNYSFDSAMRLKERLHKAALPSPLHLSTVKSFHVAGDYRSITLSSMLNSPSKYISCASQLAEGARFLLPQTGHNNSVIAVYDDEPTSIISYALTSKQHEDWICSKLNDLEGSSSFSDTSADDLISPWQSFGSVDLEFLSFGSEDNSPKIGSLFQSSKKSPHLRVSFEDDFANSNKAKFNVTCYFAKEFDILRRKCCPNEVDFVRSLSRCKKWTAQGGKSNVYFAKSMDDRFIIKQVTKTELDSFEEFANDYFRYMTESLNTKSPTCLAKVLGIYQVCFKTIKGGKETKISLMVMENLFFERTISRVYDLKGSSRSRYNSDTSGENRVLLDSNLLETLRTNPIFLGSKAKRSLERAVWNDTSFLASVDVMDYSLLVGVDEESKELVLGIIDYMRQYTWDKHLETWVKASGILGGPKNASPTIISPKQYKLRFRKAMTAYFLTVPDHWSS
ncbi:hypothetical protein V2J09_001623 [Rumex salicifolius]